MIGVVYTGLDCWVWQPGVPSLGYALSIGAGAVNVRLPLAHQKFVSQGGLSTTAHLSGNRWDPSSKYGSLCVHPRVFLVLGRVSSVREICATPAVELREEHPPRHPQNARSITTHGTTCAGGKPPPARDETSSATTVGCTFHAIVRFGMCCCLMLCVFCVCCVQVG